MMHRTQCDQEKRSHLFVCLPVCLCRRQGMEENALLAVSGADVIRKSKDHDSRKKKMRSKCTVSGLEFIDLDATISGKPQARRCGKNKGYRKGNR